MLVIYPRLDIYLLYIFLYKCMFSFIKPFLLEANSNITCYIRYFPFHISIYLSIYMPPESYSSDPVKDPLEMKGLIIYHQNHD